MTRAFLFNPGLINSWFVVTGILGLLLILNGSIVASAAMVKEREAGTIEQLVMSPAETSEIIVAKIAPLFLLLMLMVIFATAFMKLAFNVPFHGNLFVVFCGASLCILSGIALGTVIATFSKVRAAGTAHQLFCQSPAHHGVGRGHAGGGGSALAAAAGVDQSDSPFQRDRPLQHDQRHRLPPGCGRTF